MSIRWSSQQEASLLKDFAAGVSLESIGASLGKTVGNVTHKLKLLLTNLLKTNTVGSVCSQMNMSVDQLKEYVDLGSINKMNLINSLNSSSSLNSIKEEIARIKESLARLEASL